MIFYENLHKNNLKITEFFIAEDHIFAHNVL